MTPVLFNPLLEELTFPRTPPGPLPSATLLTGQEHYDALRELSIRHHKERPFSFADSLLEKLDSPSRPDVRTALRLLAQELSR